MKKQLLVIPFLILNLFSCSTSGNTDDTIYKTVYDDGTASINISASYNYSDLIIPSSVEYEGKEYVVTSISSDAFKNNKYIENVVIPDTIKSSGWDAFRGCTNLKTIDLGKGIETIPDHFLADCSKLTTITGGDNVKSIYKGAFQGTKIENIYFPNVEELSIDAFWNNSKLKEATILGTYTELPGSLFEKCSALEKITIAETCNLISSYTFKNCSSLKELNFNDEMIIENNAFENCGFEKINLKNCEINNFAFYKNKSLKELKIDGNNIGYKSFADCSSLNNVLLTNVQSIGSQAFINDKIESLSFDNVLESIESEAFENNNLTSISFSLDGMLKTINRKAFYNNPLTGNIDFPHGLEHIYRYAFMKTGIESIKVHENTVIDSDAFEKNVKIN